MKSAVNRKEYKGIRYRNPQLFITARLATSDQAESVMTTRYAATTTRIKNAGDWSRGTLSSKHGVYTPIASRDFSAWKTLLAKGLGEEEKSQIHHVHVKIS
ncbi:hypothetical protein BZA77DRAFT_293263 [Pyronema omphalodes]|nr:hypothetical protein BZA77DRAFT_293263 [Pyronema omphalodes]